MSGVPLNPDLPLIIIIDLRCAYCGLDHKVRVKVVETISSTGQRGATAMAAAVTEGCDVLDWHLTPASTIEPE